MRRFFQHSTHVEVLRAVADGGRAEIGAQRLVGK